MSRYRIMLKMIPFLLIAMFITGCSDRGQVMDGDGMFQKIEYTQITQEEAKQMMEQDDGHVIVDVRRQDEYDEGHIPGAILIPNESIEGEPPKELPDQDQTILVYCRSGRRSKEASQKLADMGYSNVYEFGGIIDWTGDIEKGEDEQMSSDDEKYDMTPIYQDTFDWEDDPTIGKVQAGCYKRVGITKKDETYEEMLELRDIANKGYLVVCDDGTAFFKLDGEQTAYLYDEFNFYRSEDSEKTNGIPYVYIGGRLITNDGSTITQYLMLSDEESEAVFNSKGEIEFIYIVTGDTSEKIFNRDNS